MPYAYGMPMYPQYNGRVRAPVMPPMVPMPSHMPVHHGPPAPPASLAHPAPINHAPAPITAPASAPVPAPAPTSAPVSAPPALDDPHAPVPAPTVYLATYSSVPVYEITVRGIALMRRRSDGYLNATQILKIAGIEKARRTRILEKEILTGEHDKVQGGFGTFQGTWIPLRRAQELATAYSVYHLIRPLLEFDISLGTAPPAPAVRRKAAPETERMAHTGQQPRFLSLRPPREEMPHPAAAPIPHPGPAVIPPQVPLGQWVPPPPPPPPAAPGVPPPAPAPLWPYADRRFDLAADPAPVADLNALGPAGGSLRAASRPAVLRPRAPEARFADKAAAPNLGDERERNMREVLTGMFVSDSRSAGTQQGDEVPEAALYRLLSDLPGDVNLVIDDHGHTALHWAAALCKIPLVRILISIPPERGGANIFAGNYQGETALQRSVLVTNSYENSQFAELLSLLQASLHTRDSRRRTVLHHITLVAGLRGRAAPARYYLGCVLDHLAANPGQRGEIIDAQDDEGETALNIAARLGNTHMIKMLLDAGARKDLPNYLGITPLDWGISAPEDHSSSSRTVMGELASLRAGEMMKSFTGPPQGPVLKSHDVRDKLAATLDELNAVYDGEVATKVAAIKAAQVQLQTATRDLAARRRHIASTQRAVLNRDEARRRAENLECVLTGMIGPQGLSRAQEEPPRAPKHAVDEALDAYGSPSGIVALRWALSWLRERCSKTEKDIETVRASAREHESKCRRVVAMCAHVPIEKVDDMLDELLVAVESIGPGVGIDSVASFMHKIGRVSEGAEGGASAPPTHGAAGLAPPPPVTEIHST